MTKGIVVYDSFTGNTRKVAEGIAAAGDFYITKVDDAPSDLTGYDLLILGTLNVRAHPSEKIIGYMEKAILPKRFALFLTFGMPVWGQISSLMCLKQMRRLLEKKGARFVGSFMCPGFHLKYKTYKGRPSERDLLRVERFTKRLLI